MSNNSETTANRLSEQAPTSYEEARDLLQGRDFEKLSQLASDEASYREMLFFLSADDNPEIRSRVAANPSTPIQADEVLSKDPEPAVRQALGYKVARRLPTLSSAEENWRSAAITILERLVEDEEVRVRRIIAQELKLTDTVPLHIIQKLAHDIDESVNTLILCHSPILDNEELISIIKQSATTPQLRAIADRRQVSGPVAECIVETADVEAISQLLLNPSAQIRENTLDQLIAGAKDNVEWHEPLVIRPNLPFGAIRKIADFVAGSLIEVLSQRHDIDDELREDLERRVQLRLAEEKSADTDDLPVSLDEIESNLRQLHARGTLNEDYIRKHIDLDERNVIILSLAILADVSPIISRRIFMSQSAKAVMSLAWKAGVSAALATRIQSTVANIPADHWVLPNNDEGYPFSIREMQWQLALFLDQEENTFAGDEKNLEMCAS